MCHLFHGCKILHITYLMFEWRIFFWDLSKNRDLELEKVEVHRLVKLLKNLKFYMR